MRGVARAGAVARGTVLLGRRLVVAVSPLVVVVIVRHDCGGYGTTGLVCLRRRIAISAKRWIWRKQQTEELTDLERESGLYRASYI